MKLSIFVAAVLSVVGTGAWDCNNSKQNKFLRVPSKEKGKALVRLTSVRHAIQDKFPDSEGEAASVVFCIPREDRDWQWDQYGPLPMNCNDGNEFNLNPEDTGLAGPVTVTAGGACSHDQYANLEESWFEYEIHDALGKYAGESFSLDGNDQDKCGDRKDGLTCKFRYA